MNDIWISSIPSNIPCSVCGGIVYEFSIPNDLWNKIIRVNGIETDKEYLCMGCFLDSLRHSLGMDM